MKRARRRRLLAVLALLAGTAAAAGLLLQAFRSNLTFFYTPAQVEAGEAPPDRLIRIGGLVAENSVKQQGLLTSFAITDTAATLPVEYEGVLPDLFREGQGVVARGRMAAGVFRASEVLAKHDENYMPPEAAAALEAGRTLQLP